MYWGFFTIFVSAKKWRYPSTPSHAELHKGYSCTSNRILVFLPRFRVKLVVKIKWSVLCRIYEHSCGSDSTALRFLNFLTVWKWLFNFVNLPLLPLGNIPHNSWNRKLGGTWDKCSFKLLIFKMLSEFYIISRLHVISILIYRCRLF